MQRDEVHTSIYSNHIVSTITILDVGLLMVEPFVAHSWLITGLPSLSVHYSGSVE